jgi:hypothetical protein
MTSPKRGKGRPNRAEASALALAGIDVSACNPITVLQEIAMDHTAPASARVAAAKALMKLPATVMSGNADDMDDITRKAIAALAKGRLN